MPIRPENRHRYPPNWPRISCRIRFVRAAGRCECAGECGRGTHIGRCPNRHGAAAYDTGSRVVLTVAHLDHAPENCADENLRAMCNGCHLHYDRDHHAQTAAATRAAALAAPMDPLFDLPKSRAGATAGADDRTHATHRTGAMRANTRTSTTSATRANAGARTERTPPVCVPIRVVPAPRNERQPDDPPATERST